MRSKRATRCTRWLTPLPVRPPRHTGPVCSASCKQELSPSVGWAWRASCSGTGFGARRRATWSTSSSPRACSRPPSFAVGGRWSRPLTSGFSTCCSCGCLSRGPRERVRNTEMTSAKLSVNGTEYTLPEVDGVTLQFALRDDLGLTGTKFGCGMSQCGACTVLVDGTPTTSCVTPVASVLGKAGSVGAGLMISALVPTQSFAKQLLSQTGGAPVALAARTPPTDVDAYLHLGADGNVTVFTGKVEFGQGIQTAFAQLVAEELDVSFDRVDMVMGITNQTPYDIGTFGSLSIRTTGVALRQAAAEMRQWLLELGATRFGTATDGLATRDGAVYVASQPSVSAGYGDLALGE